MKSDNGALLAFLHGPAVRAMVDLPADTACALDVWAAAQASPLDRQAAILFALRDRLTGLSMPPIWSNVVQALHL